MRKHYRLMIPGPIEISPDVLAHMSDPLTAHYGDRWVEIWRKTVSNLQRVIGTEGDVFPLVGSGHTANDVVMNSLFNPGDRILTLDNGLFGKRLDDLARAFGLDSVV
ncbi:MAG: alanine--glyoxylate aminotransferase family protein, partial [Gemmatimonadota bacterium]|nr:alanine--glyoxylate aminotransferase family protein [Gemmatimonadota bacterium]